MDPRYPEPAERFRGRVRSVLDRNLPAGWRGIGALGPDEAAAFTVHWRKVLAAEHLLGLAWPTEHGGAGLGRLEQVVLAEELAAAGVPGGAVNDTFGIKMLGNTLLQWGTEAQRGRLLPRILSGEDVWCQGFSEPDAGSDLAGLRCRARRTGDRWVIDGQKLWTSAAQTANWIFLLARTDATASRHRGLTFLLCPMDQSGVRLQPIKMLSGESEFNEVFFTGATTAADNVVGDVDGGWAVARTLLQHERGEEAATNPVLFRAELDRLVALVKGRGLAGDPMVRQRLAACHAKVEIMRYLGLRIVTAYVRGGTLGPEASISKLYWSEYHQVVTELALDVLGLDALVPTGRRPPRAYRTDDPGAPNTSGSWVGAFYNARAGTIYAGTSQIQRNILGETVLGLPRGPRAVAQRR